MLLSCVVIISIGTDIIEVARIRQTITRTPRFIERVFTLDERGYCEGCGEIVRAQHYAVRFAAKEAVFKALGTGWRDRLAWHDVEVARHEQGAPRIILHGRALEMFASLNATRTHLSLSHTAEHAVAFVVFES